jgi:hypothetical protein
MEGVRPRPDEKGHDFHHVLHPRAAGNAVLAVDPGDDREGRPEGLADPPDDLHGETGPALSVPPVPVRPPVRQGEKNWPMR